MSDGKRLWWVDTSAQFYVVKNFFGVASAPIVEGGLLILPIGGSPLNSPKNVCVGREQVKGNGSGIITFNKWTGKVVYQIADELASYASPTLATINGRRWCFVFVRGGLIAFEPRTGMADFHYPWRSKKLESVNASNPAVVGNLVFIIGAYGP